MAKLFNLVSGDAQRSLEEFSSEFDEALAVAEAESQWANTLGLFLSSSAIKTTYPVPIDAAGYRKRKGDDKMRRLFQRSLSIVPEEYQDGVMEKATIVEAPDFVGWAGAPGRIAMEAARHANTLTAEMLEANANLDFYKDPQGGDLAKALFADDHPINVLNTGAGSFDNNQTSSGGVIDATFMKAVKQRFRARKGANGKPMGLRMTHLLVPAAREEEAKDFLESDNLLLALQNVGGSENVAAGPTNNRHKGTVELVVSDELTNDDVVYSMALNKGAFSWVLQEGATEQITFDKSDHMYKTSGMIGMSFTRLAAVVGALPHGIEKMNFA